ncbi:MAG TPA: ATP-binding cassette domain-containing protein, partial [Syntrophorhabdus sp.]|nr:ATP-binding cassette domain-containing protein [Syntrophorhabdus sp.]
MLKAEAISASYGRVKVLKDIDMSVESGEIVCLVGANGAGKSTLLKVISGI